ncbi:hypothetical protein Pyn_29017 [Prunus yedoensis var. nudiflora]|uniref:Uncharacterized protein n=1 Tax=Prunus yedoensis var. nudiflora TaxID=2094558 RepID=A0A314ZDS3_PRUYE|nr:hypothetical protein Pyn_29017 [Prunus yedoensis var. nudiflora]
MAVKTIISYPISQDHQSSSGGFQKVMIQSSASLTRTQMSSLADMKLPNSERESFTSPQKP